MQDDNFKIHEEDPFCESIRQKLADVELPVDEACWAEIEAKLATHKKRKVIPFWWWLSGGAAVASLALIFTIGLHSNRPEIALRSSVKNPSKTQKTIALASIPVKVTNNASTEKSVAKIKTIASAGTKQIAVSTPTNSTTTEQKEIKNELIATNTTTTASIENKEASKTSTDSLHTKTEKKNLPDKLVAKNEPTKEPEIARKKNNDWMLLASVGQNGAASFPSAGNGEMYAADATMANGEKNLTDAQNTYSSILSPSDFSDKTFNPGISFGLMIRKNLSAGVSFETGLMYTYLQSTFRGSNWYSYDASMQLHYLGIPVNINIDLWKKQRWSIYWMGGMMVEKGLRSVYTQHQYYQSQTTTTSAGSKIDGIQWSLCTGLGANYQLYKNIGLYLEPDVSYFFDNNQPVSSRTEYPTSVGIKAGLRFTIDK